ncbi:hypothetical protein BaRGS_00004021, partial [Batillaria attramentaria]
SGIKPQCPCYLSVSLGLEPQPPQSPYHTNLNFPSAVTGLTAPPPIRSFCPL